MDPQLQHADTVPGFTMQSEGFYLKFVTGLQCGVSSKLLEYETDWYEVMEIILSRLQDEPENKERFEIIASRDLEYWARIQPGGDTLNLKIRVSLEEKRYHLPPNGSRKNLRLIFNDRFSTEVVFYARKKMLLKSLKDLAAVGVADHFSSEESIVKLRGEIPNSLIPNVQRAFQNCWTARFWRTKIVPCPYWCICKVKKKTPLGLSESKAKTPTNTRRQLMYKKVADKHVRTPQHKKVVKKKVESKNAKLVELNKKANKNVKKVDVKGNPRKRDSNNSKKSKKKMPVSKSVDSAKTKPAKNSKSTQNKSTISAKQNSSKGKSTSIKDKRSTPGVKKSNLKKTGDNIKALKDKVRAMKNKLKTLMEAVAVNSSANRKSKSKKNTSKTNNSPKRNATKRNAPIENAENPVMKRKVDVKNKPQQSKEIFSPRTTRRSTEPIVKSSSSRESKSKSKNANVKSKSNKVKSSDIDAKFTKSKFNDAKFTKSPKQKIQRASPRSMPPRNKSNGSKSESKWQNPKQLKRSLRSQDQEVPSKKRRQG